MKMKQSSTLFVYTIRGKTYSAIFVVLKASGGCRIHIEGPLRVERSHSHFAFLFFRISTRMTSYRALANFRTFNIDGVKSVLLLLWDIINIELESFLERTNPYGSYQEETTDMCKLSGVRLSVNKQEA